MASSLVDHVSLFQSLQQDVDTPLPRSNSKGKPTRSESPKRRNYRMRQEQIHAAQQRVAREASRPKLLIDDSSPYKLKTPRSYIRQAKDQYRTRRTRSTVPSIRQSPFRLRISAGFQGKGQTDASRDQLISAKVSENQSIHLIENEPILKDGSAVIPTWISQREDFAGAYKRIKSTQVSDLEAICRKEGHQRSLHEKTGLFNWAETVPALGFLPAGSLNEVLDRLHTVTLRPKDAIDQTPSLIVVLRGVLKYRKSIKNEGEEAGPGTCIGEEIVQGLDSSITILSPSEECVFLRLRRPDIEQVMAGISHRDRKDTTDFLSTCPFFKEMSILKLHRLSRVAERCEFAHEEVIFRQDENSTGFYIVRTGEVHLQVEVDVGQNNRWPVGGHAWEVNRLDMVYNLTLKTCKAGDYFGISELMTEASRQTSAKANGVTVCYVVSREKSLEVFTRREISDLQIFENVRIPSNRECEKQVLNQFKERRDMNQALITAAEIDYKCPQGTRTSILDRQTRKMLTWISNLKRRSVNEERKLRKGIVRVHHDRVVIHSADMLGVAEGKGQEPL